MEAKEVMVGDWVKYGNRFALIQSITPNECCILVSCGGSDEFVWETYDNIEPVPLTSEILEKNGFTKSTPPTGIHARCYELDNKKDRYHLTIADYNKYKRLLLNVDSEDSECFNIKCDYVHEFQHALRLCGINKNIEL
jgi:hypothetical protein